jgi:subtilisin-like proprotein convertase family protein
MRSEDLKRNREGAWTIEVKDREYGKAARFKPGSYSLAQEEVRCRCLKNRVFPKAKVLADFL